MAWSFLQHYTNLVWFGYQHHTDLMIIPQELILTITENVSVEKLQAIRIKIEGRRAVSPTLYVFKALFIVSKFLCRKGL